MKIRQLLACALVLVAASAVAADFESILRRALPLCPGEVKVTEQKLAITMPSGMSAKQFLVEGEGPICTNRYVVAMTPPGNVFIGSPWPLASLTGTPAEKIRQFALQQLEESLQPVVGTKKNDDGLLPVELHYTTEYGKSQMTGFVDPAGTMFFPGYLIPATADVAKFRLEKLAPVLAGSPTRGPADAPVLLVEFSDFQCPSCKFAAGFLKPLLEKYADKVRYTRIDYPLMSHHPWAFGAAVIGRAVYQQNRDTFWTYKDAIYENQADLNLFTLEDFARGFASDHGLNVETFNTALNSEHIRRQLLESVAMAEALHIRGTPTFLVNGQVVVAGQNGKNLETAIERALKK